METVGLLLLIESQGEQEVFHRAAQRPAADPLLRTEENVAAKRFSRRTTSKSPARERAGARTHRA
jgi:hypothetical protein